jgi:hypothetical protein
MAKYIFNEYAHDTYESSETAWRLCEEFDWPEEVAETYAHDHKPMYEVKGEFEYDSDTGELTVIAAIINGVRLVPEQKEPAE